MARYKKQTVWLSICLAVLLLGGTGCSDKAEEMTDMQATAEVMTEAAETQTLLPIQTETPVRTRTAELQYWNVALPEDMTWQEFTDGENYRVEFGIMLGGEHVLLYTIHVGDAAVEEVLGEFAVDGIIKTVGVNTHRLSTQMPMTSEDAASLFSARMDTLEDVIWALEQNEDFSKK